MIDRRLLDQVLALPVLNGWGLTETSPVLACRRVAPARDNVRGTVGLPTPGTAVRVVDPDTLQPLPMGAQVRPALPALPSHPSPAQIIIPRASIIIIIRLRSTLHALL